VDVSKFRKRNVLLLLATTMIFGLASVTPASSQTSASTSTLNSGGVLRLRLGATDQWKFQPTPGIATDEETQGISSGSGCGLTAASLTGSLAKLTATNGSVGFVSDSLGVRGAGEGTGQPCGRIDGSQTLTLELGSRFTNPTSGPKRAMDFAEIDVEAKFNAKFQIAAWFGSTPVGSPVIYDTMGSDSGPDSRDLDNYRIRFPKTGKSLFTKLTFSVISGGISVEGGSDGTQACDSTVANECLADGSFGETILEGQPPTPTKDSLFHLVQYDTLLNCNDPAFTQGGGAIPLNSLERKNNEDGTCDGAVPIDLDASIEGSEQLVSLRKDLGDQAAQFFWTVTWTPEGKTLPVKVTKFDFGDGTGYRNIQWCLADDAVGAPDSDTFPELPSNDPWCLTSQHSDLDALSGKLTVKETYFGLGDPGAKR
jgi:hypothetical protein